jgi:N-acetylglucosamine kinase-like BadF-type ATPase
VSNEPRVFLIDPDEIDRYARAIARIADKGHPAGSTELERAVNTYGTAFQFLVMRRGPEYGRALGMAAGSRALSLVERRDHVEVLVSGDIGDIHERVCVAEEEALAREQDERQEADG